MNTSAQWQTLTRSGVLILDKGADWVLVLVDDQQLTDLARWRFNPEETNALATLAGADAALAQTLEPLLNQMQAAQQQFPRRHQYSHAPQPESSRGL